MTKNFIIPLDNRLFIDYKSLPYIVLRLDEIEGLYAAYLERQSADIEAFRRDENLILPPDLDFDGIGGLSNEAREKLNLGRPATLGAAGRISGVTPAALTILLRHVRRGPRSAA